MDEKQEIYLMLPDIEILLKLMYPNITLAYDEYTEGRFIELYDFIKNENYSKVKNRQYKIGEEIVVHDYLNKGDIK